MSADQAGTNRFSCVRTGIRRIAPRIVDSGRFVPIMKPVDRLKILGPARGVWVRCPPPAPKSGNRAEGEMSNVRAPSICVSVVLALLLAASVRTVGQQLLNWAGDDGKRVATLTKTGTRLDGDHATLWFPPSLSHTDAEALVKRIDPPV